ncbi:MAG: DMT family transporter [Bacteroidales bacterium]|nr:DMT family transporter [Bacteroidales bacterium]MBS3777303.1 DMT family transporter [Bacteroidales bacterium]
MLDSYFGEFASLMAAFCWTATALAFESAGKKIGSLSVNLIRLFMAIFMLGIFTWITRGLFLPVDASWHQWKWLIISGLIGFSLGDLFLFEAYVRIGARISSLIMSFVPPITGLIGWLIMDERLSAQNILGMAITLTGIILVISQRKNRNPNPSRIIEEPPKKKRIKMTFSYHVVGIIMAFGGAVGQATGLVLSKFGMQDYNAFAATQIRVFAGTVGFMILFFILRRWKRVMTALKNRKAMKRVTVGAFFGPFLGVAFSLLAVQNTLTGIASTLMALVPVLIIPPAVLYFKERVNFLEILGAFIAFAGVALFFL